MKKKPIHLESSAYLRELLSKKLGKNRLTESRFLPLCYDLSEWLIFCQSFRDLFAR